MLVFYGARYQGRDALNGGVGSYAVWEEAALLNENVLRRMWWDG